MKSARYGLSRHLQIFFETELCGLFHFNEAQILPQEAAPIPEGWSALRRPPFGRYREIVAIRFGAYDMNVMSPSESPPLGQVVLVHPDGEESGPLDHATWQRIGSIIRDREGKIQHAA